MYLWLEIYTTPLLVCTRPMEDGVSIESPLPTWYVYLSFNMADETHPRCQINVHQYPEEAVFLLNQLQPPSSSSWVLVSKMGPFIKRIADLNAAKWNAYRTRRPTWLMAKGEFFGHHLHALDPSSVLHAKSFEMYPLPTLEEARVLQQRQSVYESSRKPLAGLPTPIPNHPPRASQIHLHDVKQAWIRPDLFISSS